MFGGFDRVVTGLIEHVHTDFHDYRSAVTKLNQIPHVGFEVDPCASGCKRRDGNCRTSVAGALSEETPWSKPA
jgi:hypothetical protein